MDKPHAYVTDFEIEHFDNYLSARNEKTENNMKDSIRQSNDSADSNADEKSSYKNSAIARFLQFAYEFVYTSINIKELSRSMKFKYFLAHIFLLISPIIAYAFSMHFLSESINKILLFACLLTIAIIIILTIISIAKNGVVNPTHATATKRAVNDIKAAIVEALVPITIVLAEQFRLAIYNQHPEFIENFINNIVNDMTVPMAFAFIFTIAILLFIICSTFPFLHYLVRLPLYIPYLPAAVPMSIAENGIDLWATLIGLVFIPLGIVLTILLFVPLLPIMIPIMLLARKLMRPAYQPPNETNTRFIDYILQHKDKY